MRPSPQRPEPTWVPRLRRRPLGRYRYVRLRWRVFFAVVDWLGAVLFAAVTSMRPSARSAADPTTILLVQLDHLGDAILTTAMLPALRARYPEASIEVLAAPWNREVFLARPEIDRVHVSRVNRFARGGLARLGWIAATFWWGVRLRWRRIDLGIDVRGELPVALMLWLGGVWRRLGWASGGGGFLLTDSAEFVPGRAEVESRVALLAALGIDLSRDGAARPCFRPSDAARRRIARELAEFSAGQPVAGPLVVLHVGAGSAAKSWPAECWRELLGRIILGHGAQVILVGTRSDRIIADRVLDGREWSGVADWTGRLTVGELAALLERAAVFVGADSGPAHLAAAVDAPVVVLFSGTNDPQQWRPRGRRVEVIRREVGCSPCHRARCPRPGHPCMQLLRPAEVAAEVAHVLGQPPDNGRDQTVCQGVRA